MVKNYLKVAIRNLLRFKVYSFINIVGLAVGMASCIVIFIFVLHQYSYDSFNKKAERIYRVNVEANINGKTTNVAVTPASLGPYLVSQFPQIERAVRLYAVSVITASGKPLLRYGDKVLRANHFVLVDSSFLDVFSFRMIQGDPETALDAPFSVVLTKDAAQKLFGDENPIGKDILYNNKFRFSVTGVVANPPENSTIQFDYLGSLNSLPDITNEPNILRNGDQFNYYTYALIRKNASIRDVDRELGKVVTGFWDKNIRSMLGSPAVYFEPLRDLYWDNNLTNDIPIKGSKSDTVTFSAIAVIILLIACANFINLSTARYLTRAKEIGIKKVLGAQRRQLVSQFMTESGLLSFIALLAAIMLSELFIPSVNRVLGMDLRVDYFHNLTIIFFIIGIWTLTSLLSGILPAFYLSSFRPVYTLKGNMSGVTGKGLGRQFFILFQFSAAIAVLFCSIVVAKQYNLLRLHNLGFNRDNIVVLQYDQRINGGYGPFKQKLLQNPHVLGVSGTDVVPGGTYSYGQFFYTYNGSVENLPAYGELVDPDYISVLGLKLLAGRDFSRTNPSDAVDAYILNQAAVKKIGWTTQSAVGQPFGPLQSGRPNGHVIGVVGNFNFQSLRSKVEPLVLIMRRNDVQKLAVKVSADNVGGTLEFIENTWKKMFPNTPIEYNFLDKNLDALYKSEEKLGVLFTWFSFLAIVVACLGLYGLALFTAERRTKEVGIRKVLGASTHEIVVTLSKEFMKWVIIANVIAWPIAYYAMNKWLQNFAYKIEVVPWMFLLSGIVVLVIALLTVSFHAIKAATANPVESLRYE